MSKFNTFLVAIGMVFLAFAAQAQLTFTMVPSDPAPDLGEQFTVDVVVNADFQEIASFQYSINWDPTKFSFQGLSNFGLPGLTAGSFNTTMAQTSLGRITNSWSDPMAGSQSIDSDSVIYTIAFEVIATEASTSMISFSSTPLSQEIISQDAMGNFDDLTGTTIFNAATIDIAGGGDPGTGISCDFTGFGMIVTSDSADTGDPVCLDVIACNFSEIVSFQYTTQFNPDKLQFDSLTNFNLDNLSAGNFGTTNIGNGFITSSWLDTLGAGVTVMDETVLYSICFTAIGAGGDLDTVAINGALSPIEVTDANSGGSNIGLESIDGQVNITGNSSSAVSVSASCEQGNPGDTVTVAVSVANFDSISGLQMSMLWDPAIIDFLDTEWTGQLPGSPTFNTNSTLTDAGKLALLWDDPMGATSSVMDDSVIFNVRYVIVGDVTDVSVVSFTDDPTSIEVTQVVNGSLQTVPLARIPGKVEVIGEGVLGFIIEDAIGCTNDTICVPVTVDNFNEITSMQYDFTWNSAELDFIRTQDYNSSLEGLNTGSFNQYAADKIRLSWTQALLEPRTLGEDNDTLFTLCFQVLGLEGSTANLSFDETQTIEISGGQNADLIDTYTIENGVITVSCAMDVPMTVSDTTITNVLCNGESTGAIAITLADETGSVSFNWSNGATSQNISGIAAGTYTVTITDDNTTLIETYTVSQPASPLSVSMSSTDVSINGGSDGTATATPSGGTAPYTYNWDNGGTTATITGLTFGTYAVTITDANNCTITDQVAVNQPGSVTAVINSTDISCNGAADGSATVTPGGGVPGYTYLWSNTATSATVTGLMPGNYSVTVTDSNSATATASVVITQPDVLTASVSGADVSCNGATDGQVSVVADGGTTGYTYLWSSGNTTAIVNNLGAGSYTVTVTDANMCTATGSFTINEPATVTATISSSSDIDCNGDDNGSATVTPGGGSGSGYTISWSNSATTATITNLSAGTYLVTVTDSDNCTATTSVVITEPTALSATLSTNDIDCNGDNDGSITAAPSGGTGAYSYVWSNGATGSTITGLVPGSYTVTITDENNCSITENATITEPTELTVTGVVTNESASNAEDGAIDITPLGGTEPWTYLWSNGATTQDISNLVPGTFTVTITDSNGCTVIESFTVNSFEAPQIAVESVTDVQCNGGSDGAIDISVSGGVSPYTYLWSNGAVTQDISNLLAGNYTVTVTDNIGTTAIQTVTINQSTSISVTLDGQVDVACNGNNTGSISITVTGGTPGYTFNWGGGITAEDPAGLTVGTYTVTVTDLNGCTAVGPIVTITEPNPIAITLSGTTNVACNGESTGSIDVTITGGTPGYTYSWSDGSTVQDPSGLSAGTYILTVTDASNCTMVSDAVIITEPTALSASSSSTSISCNGAADGTINTNVSGGSPPYSYNWSGGLPNQANHANVAAGTYTVTITDVVGCSIIEGPIAVTQPAALSLSSAVINASASNDDGSIDLSVTGGTAGYTYNWNTGETSEDLSGLSSGCYSITVTDANGCTATDSVKVGGVIIISADVSNTSCAGLCDGAIDLTIEGGIAPYTYSWTGADVTINAQDQNNLCAGSYAVTVVDANGTQAIQSFVIESPTALTIASSSIINETGNGCNGSIDITITGGTLPYTYQWSNGATSEDIDDLCKGDYSVTIVDANGCILISNQFTVLPAPLVVSMSSMTMASCSGNMDGEACLSVLGGCGPYTVTLGTSTQVSVSGEDICFSDLAAGTYTINVVDSGNPQMTTSQEFTISTPDPISINSNVINNTDPTGVDCDGAIDITVTGGTIPYSYQWSNGAVSEDITGLCSNGPNFSVTVTDANGCIQVLSGLEVELGLNIQVVATEDISCMGDCDGLINISVTGGVAPYSYNWSNAGTTQDQNNLCAGSYDVTVTDVNGMMATFLGVNIAEPSAPLSVVMGSMVRPSGNNADGSINLDVSGGWGGYSIQWSNGASGNPIGGLVEGFYTATVTDANGCVEVITINLTAYRISITSSLSTPSCNGDSNGQIEVIVQGGSEDFMINWDNGQTGELAFDLEAGTYCVTIVDNQIPGLEVEECFDLSEPDVLSVNPIIVNSSGPADGSIDANVSGGTAPYNYLWTSGDVTPVTAGLTSGTYGLVVTDANGCELIVQQIEVGIEGECFEGRRVISPNGDGKNDEFIISCAEGINNNLKVFNRWGQMVYEADNYDNSWAGTDASGKVLPESGYFWVLEYEENGQTKQLKGAFTLLRGDN